MNKLKAILMQDDHDPDANALRFWRGLFQGLRLAAQSFKGMANDVWWVYHQSAAKQQMQNPPDSKLT